MPFEEDSLGGVNVGDAAEEEEKKRKESVNELFKCDQRRRRDGLNPVSHLVDWVAECLAFGS